MNNFTSYLVFVKTHNWLKYRYSKIRSKSCLKVISFCFQSCLILGVAGNRLTLGKTRLDVAKNKP